MTKRTQVIDLIGTLSTTTEGQLFGEPIEAMAGRVKEWLTDGTPVRVIFTGSLRIDCSWDEFWVAYETWCALHFSQTLQIANEADIQGGIIWSHRAVQTEFNTGRRIDRKDEDLVPIAVTADCDVMMVSKRDLLSSKNVTIMPYESAENPDPEAEYTERTKWYLVGSTTSEQEQGLAERFGWDPNECLESARCLNLELPQEWSKPERTAFMKVFRQRLPEMLAARLMSKCLTMTPISFVPGANATWPHACPLSDMPEVEETTEAPLIRPNETPYDYHERVKDREPFRWHCHTCGAKGGSQCQK